MLYRLIFAVTILAATDGSAFAQRTHMVDVWGARIEVPNEGPGGLFAGAAAFPGETVSGAATPGTSTIRPLANTAPASLKTSRPRP